jgi:N-acetylmuramoyl-L-alanine amidase
MIGIQSFWQNICGFLNKRGILKKCYRCCAVITLGTTILAVASFCNKEFGGKNNLTVAAQQLDGNQSEKEGEEALEEPEQGEEAVATSLEEPQRRIWTVLQAAASEALPRLSVQEDEPETEAAQLESRTVETVAQENGNASIVVTAEEYEILTRIVEAEAGTEDVKGKMLVANIVLNRVAYQEFPDNIKDVVFQHRGERYQFSPVQDGRYYEVEVQDSTRLAVDRVLAGEDESRGALFFCERAKSSQSNLKWFDSELELLFSYGCHEFFTYAQ